MVVLVIGFVTWIVYHPPSSLAVSTSPLGTAKGTKGIYGSSGKLLTLTT